MLGVRQRNLKTNAFVDDAEIDDAAARSQHALLAPDQPGPERAFVQDAPGNASELSVSGGQQIANLHQLFAYVS